MKFLGYKFNINHKINLLPNIELLYKLFYNIFKSELVILRDYIKINLVSSFIWRSFSFADVPIFFIKKKDGTLYLIVNYRKLNFITIKDRYLLFLILDILDYLAEAEIFTKFNLIIIYNKIKIK